MSGSEALLNTTQSSNDLQQIPVDDFARRFSLRASNMMWFLGAGASASAGVPTAMDMIWGFKQALFISQNRGSSQASVDLSQPAVRSRIDAHIESLGIFTSTGTSDEYATLFQAAYPAEATDALSWMGNWQGLSHPTVTWRSRP